MAWVLVIFVYGLNGYAMTSIPMSSKEVCETAANNIDAQFSNSWQLCVSNATGEVVPPGAIEGMKK